MDEIIYVPTKRFVYFNDDGDVSSVSNTDKEPGNFIEVPSDDVANLISGKEQFQQYQVIFDTVTKTYILKNRYVDNEVIFDINNQIYQVPMNKNARPDLRVIQEIGSKEWNFILDEAIRENFRKKNVSIDRTLMFSITYYNDPHLLVRVINLQLSQLIENNCVKIPFETEIELDPNALSVYTIKRLESYQHEVINE